MNCGRLVMTTVSQTIEEDRDYHEYAMVLRVSLDELRFNQRKLYKDSLGGRKTNPIWTDYPTLLDVSPCSSCNNPSSKITTTLRDHTLCVRNEPV